MRSISQIITIVLALLAGTVYAWMNSSNSFIEFDLHIYLALVILSASSAFISGLISENIRSEKILLTTTAGILIAVIINSLMFGISLPHTLNDEIVIMLFFAGHAALLGTYAAKLARQLSFKTTPKTSQKISHKSYPRYSVAD